MGLEAHISTVTRLGKKVPDKIRPLRICLDNEATKRRILSRSSQLRSKAEWENVYVNPDMTLAECNANKVLRQELKERRNRGEKYLFIRRNKIVSLNKSHSAPMDVSPPTPRSEVPSIPASGSHASLSSSNHDNSIPAWKLMILSLPDLNQGMLIINLSIFYTNADHFLNKIDDLEMLIAGSEPDIIMITEVLPKIHCNSISAA